MRFFTIVFLSVCTSIFSRADENQCIQGSPKNQILKRTIQTSNAALVKEFRVAMGLNLSEGHLGCTSGSCPPAVRPMNLGVGFAEIPKTCIVASLKRKVNQTSFDCRRRETSNGNYHWKYIKRAGGSARAQCFDDLTVDYIHYVTNKVSNCFQGLSGTDKLRNLNVVNTVDPKVVYSMINNESGFNFTYSHNGGVGAGQLTSSAVQEMNIHNPSRTGRNVQEGQGRYFLDSVLSSNKLACRSLKPVILNDKKFKYHSPQSINCEWTSLETGLARNLIYSIGYFSFLKNSIIGPELKLRAPEAYKDPEILDMLSLIAYGPGGGNKAKQVIRTLNIRSAGKSLERVKQQLKRETYLAATSNKMREAKEYAGDTCSLL